MDRRQPKQTLLIADANPENANILKTILSPDCTIKIAADGKQALRIAQSPNPPGLILLNVKMPTPEMIAVCSDKSTKNIPIICLSEPTTEDTEVKGFELGAVDYITTPFKPSVVKARIRTHLELKHYREKLERSANERVSKLRAEIRQRKDVEDTYHALVEHAKDGIAIIHDFKVRLTNPAFCKMIGYTEDELMGAHLRKFISEEEYLKNTKRYSARIAGINLPRIYKSQIIHSDGSVIDVELNVCVIPYGKSLAALVIVRDIREEEAWKYCI
ncbi:MAG: PAS domain S-box protein [Desulfobacterales bacterium]|jgi:PAS domain S-box-containing protein